ncbi:PhzF family phenazine biosynthesis protein [Bacillus sp. DX4.1]|nr:PhzF family phenazine biosynthesis protein [Bacillus sp. DX4.1]MDM5189092.1 PhzF family phenazine biosynthesis protein [Bacillus sp. DX4.1]
MKLIIEQGQEIDKDGRIAVYVTKNKEDDSLQIEVSGNAVYVEEFQISF